MQGFGINEPTVQRLNQTVGVHRHPVLLTRGITDDALSHLKVDVLHSHCAPTPSTAFCTRCSPRKQIMRVPRLVLFTLFLSFLGGCTTTQSLNSTPDSAEDFKKSLSDIRSEFSDVELYERHWRGIPAAVGNYRDLEEKWGKADKIEKNWGEKVANTVFGAALVAFNALPLAAFLSIEAIFIYPNETHYWSKGDTQVEVLVTRLGVNGYEYRVGRWDWKKLNTDTQTGEISLLVDN